MRYRPFDLVVRLANLAMLMVNLSHALIRPLRPKWPGLSVNDLKTWFRSRKYVVETLKLLPEMPEDIFKYLRTIILILSGTHSAPILIFPQEGYKFIFAWVLIDQIVAQVDELGRINHMETAS